MQANEAYRKEMKKRLTAHHRLGFFRNLQKEREVKLMLDTKNHGI